MSNNEGLYAYDLAILAVFILSLIRVAIVLSFRGRCVPWPSELIHSIGAALFLGWLYFRVWEGLQRGWVGFAFIAVYGLTVLHLLYKYTKSPIILRPVKGEPDVPVHDSRVLAELNIMGGQIIATGEAVDDLTAQQGEKNDAQ